jgi:hypothetical protein
MRSCFSKRTTVLWLIPARSASCLWVRPRNIVVGTGGKNHYAIESPIENLEVYNDETFGVLKMSLEEGGYE